MPYGKCLLCQASAPLPEGCNLCLFWAPEVILSYDKCIQGKGQRYQPTKNDSLCTAKQCFVNVLCWCKRVLGFRRTDSLSAWSVCVCHWLPKHLSCFHGPNHSPFAPTCISRNSPSQLCHSRAAGVQAGSSTAQIVCLFAHDLACILLIREKCMPPMAQKQFVDQREMQMYVHKSTVDM